VIDSRIPRFSQAIQALALVVAFLLEARFVVVVLAAILLAAVLGGPRWSLFGRLYKGLNLPPGEPEPAAPPRFAQTLGVVFLGVGSLGLFVADPGTQPYWILGWGAALMVAVLAGLAATTSF
jgi:Domain of unknown function (DUF4395)